MGDVYRASCISNTPYSVSHMNDSDTLLVFITEEDQNGGHCDWLVALSRNVSEWHEADRKQLEYYMWAQAGTSCALSDSRVLIGRWTSTYMHYAAVPCGERPAH